MRKEEYRRIQKNTKERNYLMDGIKNNAYYKQLRTLAADEHRRLTRKQYNIILSATMAWGFILDFIICAALRNTISDFISQMGWGSVLISIIAYFVISFAAIAVIHRSNNAAVSLGGFTVLAAVMGIMLAVIVSAYSGNSIATAFFATAIVCLVTGLIASMYPDFFTSIARGLFIALLAAVIAELVIVLITGTIPMITSIAVVLIFSGYFGYDLVKAQRYIPTADNAIDSAADIYIDVINLFIRLLYIFGSRND